MGQRLVIDIKIENQSVACIYYHWSAYSYSALKETKDLLFNFLYNKNFTRIKDERLRLIKIIESYNGCIDGGSESEEYQFIQKIYPNERFKKDGSRNNGLIVLSEDGMERCKSLSEGDIVIDFDNEKIYNDVLYVYNSKEELDEYIKEFYLNVDDSYLEMENIEYNLNSFHFNEINDVINVIQNTSAHFLHNEELDKYYEIIE